MVGILTWYQKGDFNMAVSLLGGNDIMVKFSRIFAHYLASLRLVVIGHFFATLQKKSKHRKNVGACSGVDIFTRKYANQIEN